MIYTRDLSYPPADLVDVCVEHAAECRFHRTEQRMLAYPQKLSIAHSSMLHEFDLLLLLISRCS